MAAGRPTVREAEVLSGNRMVQQANAGASKGDGKTAQDDRSSKRSCRITGRIRARGPPRKRADMDRVGLRRER